MARKKAEPAKKKPAPTKAAAPATVEPAPAKAEAAPKKEAPVEEKAAPAAEKAAPAPAKKEAAPKKEAPLEEKAAPAVEKAAPAPVKKEAAPKKAAPVEEKAAPAVEKAAPAPAKKEAAPKKAAPVEEKAAPDVEKAAPAPAKKEAAPKKAAAPKKKAAPVVEEPAPVEQAAPVEAAPPAEEPAVEVFSDLPRRSVAFIGSECHPFVKTGGLGDVMYALPRELVRLNCDVRVILPRYACIPQKYQEKMIYRGEFYMDLGKTGRQYYVGIMEYVCDGVVYDFIDNQEFFSSGNPYINLVDDIPKYCFFSKAALAALNFMNWIPDIVHCHDWQAALVPVYLRTLFQDSPVGKAKSILTIHNLRFQGIYNIPTIQYWSGLPGEVFNMGALKEGYESAAPMPRKSKPASTASTWRATCATTTTSCGALSTALTTACGTRRPTPPWR